MGAMNDRAVAQRFVGILGLIAVLGACGCGKERSKVGGAAPGGDPPAAGDGAARALAHGKAHAADYQRQAEWDVHPVDGVRVAGVQLFSVYPLIPDAPGSTVFVAGDQVFCSQEPDAFERLVRHLGGAAHPDVLPADTWVQLIGFSTGIERVFHAPGDLGEFSEIQRKALASRLHAPTVTPGKAGGFVADFYFQQVSYPPRDHMPLMHAVVTVDGGGAVHVDITPALADEVTVRVSAVAGPLGAQHIETNASAPLFAACQAWLAAPGTPVTAVLAVRVGGDGAVEAATVTTPADGAPDFTECVRATMADTHYATADQSTSFTATVRVAPPGSPPPGGDPPVDFN